MPEIAAKIEGLHWVKDGIDMGELNAVFGLIRLADAGHLEKIIEEPWVIEGRNFPALESLWFLVVTHPETLDRIMSHPTIRDGITDQEAKILATLHAVNDDLLDKLLDPEQVTLEERTITLPLAGETELTIIRTHPGNDHTMDSLERSVRSIEQFMMLPFPQRQVIYLFHEAPGKPFGRKYSAHVAISADEQIFSVDYILALVAHEASHYYWTGYSRWIVEGAAEFLRAMVRNVLYGPLDWPPCVRANSIAELEDMDRDPSAYEDDPRCHYLMGEGVFRDLYRNMDVATFRQAFRRLSLHTAFDLREDECSAILTVCHAREAFIAYAPEETTTTIEKVISRWYGIGPFDLSSIGDTPVAVDIPAIHGRIEGAYLSTSAGGLAVSTFPQGPNRNPAVYLNLEYSYRPSSRLEYLPIEIALYSEDALETLKRTDLPLFDNSARGTHAVQLLHWGVTGRYWVHAYWGEQKIAEATFSAVPESDHLAIRGTISDPDGRPAEGIVLEAVQGEERFWVRPESDGTFEIVASSGEFLLEVDVLVGSEYVFAGWYDGKGSITEDPNKAFKITVDGEDVEGVDIMLPAVSDANFRGVVTGPDGRPLARIELEAKGAEDGFRVNTAPDGTFDLVVQPGSYILKVSAKAGSHYVSLGWYDGSGGITTDPSQAFEVIVDGTNVQDIAIMLPFVFDTNIRGFVTGPDGRPIEGIGLTVKGRGVRLWAKTKPGGSFHIVATSGSFVIQVLVPVRTPDGTHFHFVGWYDGSGGITTDRSKVFEVMVDDADVEGINIMLPKDPEDLL